MKRKHYSGELSKIADALGKHVGERSLSDIVKKPARVENRAQKQKRLIKDRSLYQALMQLCDNLAFTEAMFKKAIQTMAAVKDWSTAGAKWVEEQAQLLKANCRHIQQASIKNSESRWLKTLRSSSSPIEKSFEKSKSLENAGDDGTESADDDNSAESPVFALSKPSERPPSPVATMVAQEAPVVETIGSSVEEPEVHLEAGSVKEVEYLYGSSHDEKWGTRAWRASIIDKQPGAKEFTTKLEVPKEFKPGDDAHEFWVLARWPDGHQAVIKSLPVALFTARANKRKAHEEAAASKVLKKPARADENKPQYTIKHKADRNPLWVLTWMGKSACQIRQDIFGSETSPKDAEQLLHTIGEKLIANEIEVDQCYEERDQMLKEKGISIARSKQQKHKQVPPISMPGPKVAPGPAGHEWGSNLFGRVIPNVQIV